LATSYNRFKYVLTPTHGSWLNIVGKTFGKMTLLGFAEINGDAGRHRWKAFAALEANGEEVV